MKRITIILYSIVCFLFIQATQAQYNQANNLLRATTSINGSSEIIDLNNSEIKIQQIIGQASIIGTFEGEKHILKQGFIQSNYLNISTLNVLDYKSNINVEIYPNPFKKEIVISFSEAIDDIIQISIYDLLGRVVFTETNFLNLKFTLDLNRLPSSTYLLLIKSKNKNFIKKIIKN